MLNDDDKALLCEFLAVRECIAGRLEQIDQMSEEQVFACLSDVWMAYVEAGFAVPAAEDGQLKWDDTKKGDKLIDILQSIGALPPPDEEPDETTGHS